MSTTKKPSNHLTHEEVLPLLRERPGKELVKNISLTLQPWQASRCPNILTYTSMGEFSLGACGRRGETGRIDAVIVLWHNNLNKVPRRAYCAIGCEIKTNAKDLRLDHKLDGKYLKAGQLDYYFLLATTDDLALLALVKYLDNPAIGVASLSSGKVFKVPDRQHVQKENREKFIRQMKQRFHSTESMSFHNHHIHDNDYVLVDMNSSEQVLPVVRFVE